MASRCLIPLQHEEKMLPIFTARSQKDGKSSSQGRDGTVALAVIHRVDIVQVQCVW